jgi:DNA-directed RNA polymerase subunit RPC12/RpoP
MFCVSLLNIYAKRFIKYQYLIYISPVNSMEKSLAYVKLNDENQASFRCSECHETFQKPLLATVNSHGYTQTYYACPRCLTKVAVVKDSKEKDKEETSPSVGKIKRAEVKHESSVECKHFLGYLKKRPKGTSIPDECLVCDKMVECLIH